MNILIYIDVEDDVFEVLEEGFAEVADQAVETAPAVYHKGSCVQNCEGFGGCGAAEEEDSRGGAPGGCYTLLGVTAWWMNVCGGAVKCVGEGERVVVDHVADLESEAAE